MSGRPGQGRVRALDVRARRLSLRTRILAAFAVGALVSCAAMAAVSFALTRQVQVGARERSAVRTAYVDARVVGTALTAERPDLVEVLRSLDTGSSRRALLRRDGRWYARTADVGLTAAVPATLTNAVAAGRPAIQRVRIAGAEPALVIGIPLADGDQFYVVDSLRELDNTLRALSWILVSVACGTTVASALLGAYIARRVVRPLAAVTAAARDISAGDLRARLNPATEPDVRELAAAFNHMVDELSARMARDRRFAADVSHELRSPLQTLSSAVSVLRNRRDDLDARTRTALDLVVAESSRFEQLVTDLLDLARGDAPPDIESVDVLALTRYACRSAGVDPALVADQTAGDDQWPVDRRALERVIVNLLVNAQRYGGGAVAVTVGSTDAHRYVWVDDDGPGVAAADRERIFERFVRGRAAGARGAAEGTGLGLALVAAHARAHGGTARVTDRPSGGARFEVSLPPAVPR